MSEVHTPGPWCQAKRNLRRVVSMSKCRETDRRSIPQTVAVCDTEETARVVASALKSLDALRHIEKQTRGYDATSALGLINANARDAIKNATGMNP